MVPAQRATRFCCSALAVSMCASVALAQQNRPNLIFILTDDQGVDAIQGPHWQSNSNIATPTLNRLAEQGVSFTNCRMNPNCSPTRAALMTGRSALTAGVPGVIGRWATQGSTPPPLPGDSDFDTNDVPYDMYLLSLQNQERTLAEVLHDSGYYTVLVDKWHLGYKSELGELPTQQGFDVFYDWADYLNLDDPEQVGDEHVVRMQGLAENAILNRQTQYQGKPYALFFHTIVPHRRDADSGGRSWWAVDPSLAPLTAGLGNTDFARFAQNIEALDTVLRRMLRNLGVTQANDFYDPDSHAVVFFAGDNGTDPRVSPAGQRAKNSLYEGGVRVPAFVFGENVPRNINNPIADGRQITHVDFYDTICDIIGAPSNIRDNPLGDFPRQSMSFADSIGWAAPNSLPRRSYSLLSLGDARFNTNTHTYDQIQRVAFVSDRYKLICNSGGARLDDMTQDEFYDLLSDPQENNNLIANGMSQNDATEYYDMRDKIVDYWPAAMSVAFDPGALVRYSVEHFDPTRQYVMVVYVENGDLTGEHEFYDLATDPDRQNDLVGQSMTSGEASAYNALQDEVLVLLDQGAFSPDVRVIDLPLSATLVLTGGNSIFNGPLTLGHMDVGGSTKEYRAFLKFNVAGVLPEGFTIDDVRAAQLVVGFKEDSRPSSDPLYATRDQDTGLITVHQVLGAWNRNPWSNYSSTDLGSLDLPSHVIWQASHPKIRTVPLPPMAPVSFGHNAALLDVVRGWFQNSRSNNGVALVADRLSSLPGDQQVNFMRAAGIRLTLDRRP